MYLLYPGKCCDFLLNLFIIRLQPAPMGISSLKSQLELTITPKLNFGIGHKYGIILGFKNKKMLLKNLRFYQNLFKLCCVAFFGFLCAFAFLKLFIASWNQIFTIDCYDCDLFWTVGRGMLNGLVPYKDLFETKPPGIFLLSSFSLLLNDGRLLGGVMSFLATMTLGITPGIFALLAFRNTSLLRRIFLGALGILFGTAMVFYVGKTSWNYMPEQFGVACGTIYVFIIASTYHVHDAKLSRFQSIIAGLFMFGAIIMKEPFVLTLLAAALLLSVSVDDVFRKAIIPLAVASVVYSVVLILFGLFIPYITIYLREMLGWRINSSGSLWARPFSIESYANMYENMYNFSPFSSALVVFLLVNMIVYIAIHRIQFKEYMLRYFFVILGIYLTVVAVFTGGSIIYGQHYLFAVPTYVALFFLCMWHMNHLWERLHTKIFLAGLTAILSIFSVTFPTQEFHGWLASISVEHSRESDLAKDIDILLDACDEERYFYIGLNGKKFIGHTKHSPYGPMFIQYAFYFDQHHKAIQEGFWDSLYKAKILVYDRHNDIHKFENTIDEYIADHFTISPWACSSFNVSRYPEITVYYRNLGI